MTKLLGCEDVAEITGVDAWQVRRWAGDNRVNKVGGRYVFTDDDVAALEQDLEDAEWDDEDEEVEDDELADDEYAD